MTSLVPQSKWFSSGNDFIIDGLWGRLGVQESFGETRISGATNGLAAIDDPESGQTFLYAGSVNGGLYLRSYDQAEERWSKTWTWLTKPGDAYQGSQGIGIITPSPDGKYLAVGQGNASNYSLVSAPSNGLQIGRVLADGSLSWIEFSENDQLRLNGLYVRSITWLDDKIYGTAWNPFTFEGTSFELRFDGEAISDLIVNEEPSRENLVTDGIEDYLIEAGYRVGDGLPVLRLNGKNVEIPESEALSPLGQIARVSIYPNLVDGNLIAFIGTFLAESGSDPIWQITRAEINPVTAKAVSLRSTNPFPPYLQAFGDINTAFGSSQASNLQLYGNFSFAADPYDPTGNSVFVGGNHYSFSPLAASTLYTGGLVKVNFAKSQRPQQIPLYGPRITRSRAEFKSGRVTLADIADGQLVLPFNPGAPHADSRSISFINSAKGPLLIQTDDGGVWQLPLQRSSKGLKQGKGTWWSSLSGPGMATLELNQVDWNSATNSIISSYQDNASSIGYFGDSYATNLGVGDGQIALFDDADQGQIRGYYAPQQYYQRGTLFSSDYDPDGFIKDRSEKKFYIYDDGRLGSWDQTKEATVKAAPFILPVAINPYVPSSLVQTGLFNIYEQVDAQSFDEVAIFFRPLLPDPSQVRLSPTAIDVDSNRPSQAVQSLYVGGGYPGADGILVPSILGRRSSDDPLAFGVTRISFSNLTELDLSSSGQIVDITHSEDSLGDRLYWLQGGINLNYGQSVPSTPAEQQLLRVGRDGGMVQTYTLDQLGLPLTPSDRYGYQALQYIPATDNHAALLLISGLEGVWSSELNSDGQPTGFSPMAWESLPSSGPGAYIKSLQYDPIDDLLIAATQGKGSYLYSFSGDVGKRPMGRRLLHASDLNLAPNPDPLLDKRGNEVNSLLSIALDNRLVDQSDEPTLRFKLHDAAAWRKTLEFASLYNTQINPEFKSISAATNSAFRYNNILDPVGLRFAGGAEKRGDLFFSVDLKGGVRLFNLQINLKDKAGLEVQKPLKYTVRLAGTRERLTRKITFDPLPSFDASGIGTDPVTGEPINVQVGGGETIRTQLQASLTGDQFVALPVGDEFQNPVAMSSSLFDVDPMLISSESPFFASTDSFPFG